MFRSDLLALRHCTAEALVGAHESATTELFGVAQRMETPHVVVIPACNEQADLPAALVSLSRSLEPVIPIVVENGSGVEDRTVEYAERLGAIVLTCEPAKMRATQVGLQFAREHFPEQSVIHFGDADNLYPRVCIPAMSRAARRASARNQEHGALVFGMGAFTHGPSPLVDLLRSGRIIRKAIERKLRGQLPMPYGANYALSIGDNEELPEALYDLDPRLFVREESAICAAALMAGATVSQLVSPSAYVLSRGDLIWTWQEWHDFRGGSMEAKLRYYKRRYPDVDFLANPNGRN